MAADGGATAQQMQRAFSWKSVGTAQKYIDESEVGAKAMASIYNSNITSTTIVKSVVEETSQGVKTVHIHDAEGTFNSFK